MRSILIRPLFTEKVTSLTDTKNQYAFEVNIDSNKIEIAKAVESKFKVLVKNVKTITYKGKPRERLTKHGRLEGRTKQWKKAIVTLKKDEKIDFFGTA
jgi:large subunit ribosomal protein L23